jgi:hypothetical protein
MVAHDEKEQLIYYMAARRLEIFVPLLHHLPHHIPAAIFSMFGLLEAFQYLRTLVVLDENFPFRSNCGRC